MEKKQEFSPIGIPFGRRHLKLAMLAMAPVGKTVVDKAYD
jgi:uncharacterized membrane protein YccF (DUF307 family)